MALKESKSAPIVWECRLLSLVSAPDAKPMGISTVPVSAEGLNNKSWKFGNNLSLVQNWLQGGLPKLCVANDDKSE